MNAVAGNLTATATRCNSVADGIRRIAAERNQRHGNSPLRKFSFVWRESLAIFRRQLLIFWHVALAVPSAFWHRTYEIGQGCCPISVLRAECLPKFLTLSVFRAIVLPMPAPAPGAEEVIARQRSLLHMPVQRSAYEAGSIESNFIVTWWVRGWIAARDEKAPARRAYQEGRRR